MDLDKLEKIYEATTKGQWEYTGVGPLPRVRLDSHGTCLGYLIADCGNSYLPESEGIANAQFIAAMHENFPCLLRLSREVCELKALLRAARPLLRSVDKACWEMIATDTPPEFIDDQGNIATWKLYKAVDERVPYEPSKT